MKIMTDSSSSEIELEVYEEIVKMNYSTPVASRASSPLSHDNNESNMTHFNGPIVGLSSSESEVVSSSTGLVASITWPDLRYPCSLAGSSQQPRLLKHLDGNLRATIRPTSGYATWFMAGAAIRNNFRIAHYDVIDDVITRKL